jgi:hypothetical protein
MRTSLLPLRRLVARTPWVIALCYALLLQAALAPVVRAAPNGPAQGLAIAFCLSDHAEDGSAPGPGTHCDMECCLPAFRTDLAGPALLPPTIIRPSRVPERVALVFSPACGPRAPPSVDLASRPARAPPLLLV